MWNHLFEQEYLNQGIFQSLWEFVMYILGVVFIWETVRIAKRSRMVVVGLEIFLHTENFAMTDLFGEFREIQQQFVQLGTNFVTTWDESGGICEIFPLI